MLAADLLGAKGLGLLRWSSRRMLCMPDEEERGGITMGSEPDWIEEEEVEAAKARAQSCGLWGGWIGSSRGG